MPIVTVSGASDDLIEIGRDGKPFEEFYCYNRDGTDVVFSDGTVLNVRLDARLDSWVVRPLAVGSAKLTVATTADDEYGYTERATVTGDLEWLEADDGGHGVRRVTL